MKKQVLLSSTSIRSSQCLKRKKPIFKCFLLMLLFCVSANSIAQNDPKFDWEKVNLGFMFDKLRSVATEAEAEFMTSKGSFLICEKAYGRDTDDYPYTEQGVEAEALNLKSYDPDFKVYIYRNAIINWPLFEAAQEFLEHEDWWLENADGTTVEWATQKSHDFSNPEVVDWYTEVIRKAVVDGNCDGVFIDAKSKLYERNSVTLGGISDEKYVGLTAGFSQSLLDIQGHIGEENHIIMNGGFIDYDDLGDEANPTIDGVFKERFAVHDDTPSEIVEQVDWFISQKEMGADFVIAKAWPQSYHHGDRDTFLDLENKEEVAAEEVGYSLAVFLMSAQENFFFIYNWGWSDTNGALEWYDEYDLKIGEPFDDYQTNGNILSRHFKHIKVKVDLDTKEATFTPDILWYEVSSSTESINYNGIDNGEYTESVGNPNVSDENNSNATVTKVIAPTGGAASVSYAITPITNLDDFRINFKAYLNNAITSSNKQFTVELMNSVLGESSSVSVDAEISNRQTWEELNFDFSGSSIPANIISNGGYDTLVLKLAPNDTDGLSLTYYIDQIEGSGSIDDVIDRDDDVRGENIALNGAASQSSTISSAVASRAIDGDTSGVWSNGSVTHTSTESNAWWQVDLGEDYNIEEVIIYNRTGCCTDRLSDFTLFVIDGDGTITYEETITSEPSPSVSIDVENVQGKIIKITSNLELTPLTIAEVEVYEGASLSSPVYKFGGTIQVYPNPAEDSLVIDINSSQESSYSILNQAGQILIKGTISSESERVDIGSLSAGLYIIKISEGQKTYVRKIIKS